MVWVSHQDFRNIACVGFFRKFVCVFFFVVVFVIVFVFVFVSSYDFWIAFIISFQNMYGYRGLWSLRAVLFIIFEVMTYIHTHIHTYSISTYRVKKAFSYKGRMKMLSLYIIEEIPHCCCLKDFIVRHCSQVCLFRL